MSSSIIIENHKNSSFLDFRKTTSWRYRNTTLPVVYTSPHISTGSMLHHFCCRVFFSVTTVKRCSPEKNIVFGFGSKILVHMAGFFYCLPLKSTVDVSSNLSMPQKMCATAMKKKNFGVQLFHHVAQSNSR
jgi:hypothetical protein